MAAIPNHPPDNIVYSAPVADDKPGELFTPSPPADDKHALDHKAGGFDYEVEKATGASSDQGLEADRKKSPYSLSMLYRRFRLPVHIFIGALFTG